MMTTRCGGSPVTCRATASPPSARPRPRAPGRAGAVLEREDVVAELICDLVHVHPSMVHLAVSAKGPSGVMAITDGAAGSGLPAGAPPGPGGARSPAGGR